MSSSRTELFLVPFSAHGGELRVLVRRDPVHDKHVLPHAVLRGDQLQRESQMQIVRELLPSVAPAVVDSWIQSPRYRDRIVDAYDRDLLFEGVQSVAIVRAVALPEELAPDAKGTWLPPQTLFSADSMLSEDCKLFARECLNLVPKWVRHSSLAFELLPQTFSIQDLRLLVSMLAGHEIDPGNFHRRLKRLDVLRPLVSGQRVHRWEFFWDRSEALKDEGLIP
jgi:hypothetical protein